MWMYNNLPTNNKVDKLDCLYASISCTLNTLCFPVSFCFATGEYFCNSGDCKDFRVIACCCCSGEGLAGDKKHWSEEHSATRNAPATCMAFFKTRCGSDAGTPKQIKMAPT